MLETVIRKATAALTITNRLLELCSAPKIGFKLSYSGTVIIEMKYISFLGKLLHSRERIENNKIAFATYRLHSVHRKGLGKRCFLL